MNRLTVIVALLVGLIVPARAFRPNPEGKYVLPPFLTLPQDNHDSLHAYDVRYYGIDLNLPMTNGSMQAHERVTLTSRQTGLDSVAFHIQALTCDSVRIAGNPITFAVRSGLLLLDLDRAYGPGESLDIDIYYRRTTGTGNRGFYWYPRSQTGYHVLCYVTTEPYGSRYWFPCYDEPFDKAEQGCAINLTVPDSLTACANGMLDSVTTGPGTKTFWWRTHYPIPTYLMTFAVSKYICLKQPFYPGPGETCHVWNYVWPEDSVDALRSFANNIDMIDFFSAPDRYGSYPFRREKYGMVETYPFEWGGMENQTMTTIHHYWVAYGSDGGISHELSHQWWGDMVTCLDWREIWLNEGFATYSDALYDYHQHGRTSFVNLMNSRAQDYFDDEARDIHPIWNPGLNRLFGWGHSYCKGAWVQHMLRYVLGDTVFEQPGELFRAIRIYGDSFQYGNANTDDYCRILEQVTGRELSWFFNEWVYMAGYPRYTINWSWSPSGPNYQVRFRVAQSNGTQAPDCFHMPLEVMVRMQGRDTIVVIPVAANPQDFVVDVGSQPVSVTADPNSWLLDSVTVYNAVAETDVRELAAPLAVRPSLFRDRTAIRYTTGISGPVDLAVYDAQGRRVRTLVRGCVTTGTRHTHWDGRDDGNRAVNPGVYFCRLTLPDRREQVKLTLTR